MTTDALSAGTKLPQVRRIRAAVVCVRLISTV